jgi:hypothetical protein
MRTDGFAPERSPSSQDFSEQAEVRRISSKERIHIREVKERRVSGSWQKPHR